MVRKIEWEISRNNLIMAWSAMLKGDFRTNSWSLDSDMLFPVLCWRFVCFLFSAESINCQGYPYVCMTCEWIAIFTVQWDCFNFGLQSHSANVFNYPGFEITFFWFVGNSPRRFLFNLYFQNIQRALSLVR